MSYTKQTWANGDIITAAKLNHMEDGIVGTEADVADLKSALQLVTPTMRNGSQGNPGNANAISTNLVLPTNGAKRIKAVMSRQKTAGHKYYWVVGFYSQAGGVSSSSTYRVVQGDPWSYTEQNSIVVDVDGYAGIAFSIFEQQDDGQGNWSSVPLRVADTGNCLSVVYEYDTPQDTAPSLSNGSLGNPSNASVVHNTVVIPYPANVSSIRVDLNNSTGEELDFEYSIWTYNETAIQGTKYQSRVAFKEDVAFSGLSFYAPMEVFLDGVKSFAFTISAKKNGNVYSLRAQNLENFMSIHYEFSDLKDEVEHKLDNARHVKSNTREPLTILHFSDLHFERDTLNKIVFAGEQYGEKVDDFICTGDMVANTGASIASWWNKKVLTCIGNHDTATYNSGTGYNWTAVSMANRDAYYIAPFESEWGITHTSGTSYYYKDYATQKVRLIVMDGMLYSGTPGAEATTQTSWLESLLADAITNNLHVLIAIHAPHGGATAVECSFSRYNQTAMPTYTDCDTPQSVIDAVAAKISSGLHFIGYLVGHTHQDNIWDAEGDGKQLMFCVTCAATAVSQNKASDMDRQNGENAFNLVTVDTANTLVKIIRGGGADIDDHMRTRKAICFNYSTGQMVGEVL